MKEILAGFLFSDTAAALNLDCKRMYCGEAWEVWEITDESFERLIDIPDELWKQEWGWFRYAEGCNISHWPVATFIVNGKYMLGFYNEFDDFWKEKQERMYASLCDYLSNVIGASTPKNVCALAVDIAKLNAMTMAELFTIYEG